jgi:outer membrane protein TolC
VNRIKVVFVVCVILVSARAYAQDPIPAVQKIDDITGYLSLLGNEEFRTSAGTITLDLVSAIDMAMNKNPQMQIARVGVERSLASLDEVESGYRSQYTIDGRATERLQRLKGGRYRIDEVKGLIQENFERYENSELFTVSPIYEHRFKNASTLTFSPQIQWEHDSDGAFDASATNPGGKNEEDRYSVDFSYNYYLNSRPREQIRQQMDNSKLSAVQADFDLFATGKSTEDAVIGQYWRIKQLEEEVDIQNERLLQARRIEFIYRTQYEFDNASEMEVGQAEVDVMNNEASLIQAEGNLRSAIEMFNIILGIALETELELTNPLDVEPLPLDAREYIRLVTSTNLQLKDSLITIQKTENSLRVARLGQQPDVYLSGSYYRTDEGRENTTGALILRWPLGDGGATRARVRVLEKQLEQQKINLWNLERNLTREAYNDLRSLQLLTKQIEIQERNVKKAYVNLDNALFNFQEFGQISFRNLQDFQLDLTQSRSSLVRSKTSYNFSKSSLLSKIHYYEPSPEVSGFMSLFEN